MNKESASSPRRRNQKVQQATGSWRRSQVQQVWSQQRQLFRLSVSSKHADGTISLVVEDEQRRVTVEGQAPDDLALGVIRSWIGQMVLE
jgi:hypothetical protein